MYIEQLSKKEIIYISKALLNIVEDNNELVTIMFKNSSLTKDNDAITLNFKSYCDEEHITLLDFDAFISYGYYTSKKQISKTYRKFMHNKFGEEYKLALEKHYKKPIEEKYQKDLKALNQEINDMIE